MSVKPNAAVASLEPYVPGEQPRDPAVIKLNTNESPYPASPQVADAVARCAAEGGFNKYPDPQSTALRQALANHLGVPISTIIAGNGSDEILRMVCHAFLDPAARDTIAVLEPTYVLYETLAAMFGCATERFRCPPGQFTLPPALAESRSKIVFIANPNPPLGAQFDLAQLERIAESNRDRLLVVDEAYVDFTVGTAVAAVPRHENLLVTRTFSKSASLAGLRVGYAIGQPALIDTLLKIKDSYNLNRVSQAAATAAVESWDYYAEKAEAIRRDREHLAQGLRARGFSVPQSNGNFVFALRSDARTVYTELKARNILVRYFDTPSLSGGVRITVGTRDQLAALLAALDTIAAPAEVAPPAK